MHPFLLLFRQSSYGGLRLPFVDVKLRILPDNEISVPNLHGRPVQKELLVTAARSRVCVFVRPLFAPSLSHVYCDGIPPVVLRRAAATFRVYTT